MMFSLLRFSQPFSIARGRGMATCEAWGVQCFPYPALFEGGSPLADTFPFPPQAMARTSDAQVWSLMGNAMNARAAGMFLVFGLFFALESGRGA